MHLLSCHALPHTGQRADHRVLPRHLLQRHVRQLQGRVVHSSYVNQHRHDRGCKGLHVSRSTNSSTTYDLLAVQRYWTGGTVRPTALEAHAVASGSLDAWVQRVTRLSSTTAKRGCSIARSLLAVCCESTNIVLPTQLSGHQVVQPPSMDDRGASDRHNDHHYSSARPSAKNNELRGSSHHAVAYV